MEAPAKPPLASLGEVALLFLKLGTIAFGGPAAHIAMMEDEVVRRRGWLDRAAFLDLLGAANLIPGPNSTELAIHIGHRVAGWRGLVVAGTCFIVPAGLIVGAIAWAYTAYGRLPEVCALLMCVKPVIIAVVLQALGGLAGKATATRALKVLGAAALSLALLGVNELGLLLASGLALAAWQRLTRPPAQGDPPPLAVAVLAAPAIAGAAPVPFGLWPLFGFFLKVGAVLYGSGYVLLAFLRADLVERWGWLTQAQLLDAVAVGQVTPGPVFTTATFIGYVLGGPAGAVVATVGIFLPAFFFVAVSGPLVPRLRRSPLAGAFLDGVNVASVALMAAVTWQLARAAIVGPWTAVLAIASAVALIRYRTNSAWLVLGGAVVGLLASWLGGR
jgi:chromate transporter